MEAIIVIAFIIAIINSVVIVYFVTDMNNKIKNINESIDKIIDATNEQFNEVSANFSILSEEVSNNKDTIDENSNALNIINEIIDIITAKFIVNKKNMLITSLSVVDLTKFVENIKIIHSIAIANIYQSFSNYLNNVKNGTPIKKAANNCISDMELLKQTSDKDIKEKIKEIENKFSKETDYIKEAINTITNDENELKGSDFDIDDEKDIKADDKNKVDVDEKVEDREEEKEANV